jgi:hypothetical protein
MYSIDQQRMKNKNPKTKDVCNSSNMLQGVLKLTQIVKCTVICYHTKLWDESQLIKGKN